MLPGTKRILFALVAALCVALPMGAQTPTGPGSLAQLSDALAAITAQVEPAVVEIRVTAFATPTAGAPSAEALVQRERRGGSGVLVSADGYIVTNLHVVEGARRLVVVLGAAAGDAPGRSILRGAGRRLDARLIGADRETDLAILKIDTTVATHLAFGDSDELGPGQLVLAFGSPLGLTSSVTMGVVSAVARQPSPESRMVYLQTDAAINPGNSGGPLVNAKAELVGINTFILSQSGGSEGIGFAAPSNIVRYVYHEIRVHGRVRRGQVGLFAQTITPTLARGLRLPREWGAIVADVYPDGPAADAGVRIGDIVLSLDGKPIENGRQFDVNVYQREQGDTVTVELVRGAERFVVRLVVVERPEDPDRFATMATRERNLVRRLGILGLDVDRSMLPYLPWLRRPVGVVVAAQAADAPRDLTGSLELGDVIYQLNGTAISTLAELRSGVDRLRTGDPIVLLVDRRGRLLFVAFEAD
jgi:serine protease Do